MKAAVVAAIAVLSCGAAGAATLSPLFARGYTVIPQPQKVTLDGRDFAFNASWRLEIDKSVPAQDVAVETLREDLAARFNLRLNPSGNPAGLLSLRIAAGSVQIGKAQDSHKSALEEQAYRIDLDRGSVKITANAATGLFYGVETFIQLLRPELGTLWLPEGTIEDWPDLELRHLYWDDNHHLEKVVELKRYMREAAFYKINGFVIKLNGHFQYKSAPAVVDPYALSQAELQELTNYGLHYHIQLIPYLDGPAHIAFILKHPEYAKLREFPESNYEICATNPASYQLLRGMYRDLLDANQGVKYFYLSTDEAYYLGLAHNAQCNEADLAKQLGSVGQVFAQFVDKTGGYLHDRGRTVIFWGEYPLKPADIPALPSYLVNGEVYGAAFDQAFRQHGIRQMIFTSSQAGNQQMFPADFILPQSRRLHTGRPGVPRVEEEFTKISLDASRGNADLMGEVNAGWGDEGLHPETFWLGYAGGAAAGWHPGSPSQLELRSTFYSLFYGPEAVSMDHIYQLMSWQAQSWSDSWDTVPSTARKPIWGWSYGIFKTPRPAKDQTLPLPPAPNADLEYSSNWSSDNANRIALTASAMQENEIVLGLLGENMPRVQFNRYNLEVYLAIAEIYRQNLEMIAGIRQMDVDLASASQLKDKDSVKAIAAVDRALDIAASIWQQRNQALENATATWYQSWLPRVAAANGRSFLHELDDVKDHVPDRTVDMSYLVYREKLLPFGEWVNSILAARNQFAVANHLPARSSQFAWDDFRASVIPIGQPR